MYLCYEVRVKLILKISIQGTDSLYSKIFFFTSTSKMISTLFLG